MMQPGEILVLITIGDEEEARNIAEALLTRRAAACVNIVPRVDSLFWWQGKIDVDDERLLVVKTRASALSEVVELVKEMHSYEVPEVIALPIIGGNEDYLKWIRDEVKG